MILFAVFGILGLRLPVVLIIGYSLHGFWDVIHEMHAYGEAVHFSIRELTSVPLSVRRFLRSLRLVCCRLFLYSAARVECRVEGACPVRWPTLGTIEL